MSNQIKINEHPCQIKENINENPCQFKETDAKIRKLKIQN